MRKRVADGGAGEVEPNELQDDEEEEVDDVEKEERGSDVVEWGGVDDARHEEVGDPAE